jgi:adenylate kinase family enzyme
MNIFDYKRIVVIGTTSSGKSTLAKQIAEKLNLQFVELDALYWEENWMPAPIFTFFERVENVVEAENWVIAGNYSSVRHIVWKRAQAIIWLDYPFHIVFWRLIKRTIQRAITKELLWGKNIEKFWGHLKIWSSDDSLIYWLFKTYWRRKRETPILLTFPEHKHLKVIHFKYPKETEAWIKELTIFESH